MPVSRPLLLVIAAFLAFSFMPVFTREASAPVLGIVAWRAVLVAVIYGAWAALSAEKPSSLRADVSGLKLSVLYGVALAIASSTFVGGYAFTTVANTVFLHNLAPIIAFPLAWWGFRERPTGQALTGATVAIGGVALLSGVSIFQFSQFANPRFLLGDLSALTSAAGYAGVLVLTRKVRIQGLPVVSTLFVAWSVAAVLLSVLALTVDTMAMPLRAFPWVLGLAVVCTNLPFYLLNLGMRSLPAGLTSVLSMSEVVFTTLIGALVYHEGLAPIGWLGALMVVIGLVYPLARGGAEEIEDVADVPSIETATPAPETSEPKTSEPETPGLIGPPAAPPNPPKRPRRPPPEPPPPMSDDSSPWRGLRLGLHLVLFNAGALWYLLGGAPAGALLAWTGLVGLLRLGARPALIMLEGRFQAVIRWGTATVAAVTIVGALDTFDVVPSGSTGLVVVAIAVAALDAVLARREDEADRDTVPLIGASLGAVAVAQGAAALGHPAGHWLMSVAALAAAAAGWTVLLAALRDALQREPVAKTRGVSPVDGVVAWIGRPVVLGPALAVIVLAGGVHTVPTGHQAVVERFGYPLPEAAEAGLLFRLPPPIERVVPVDVATVREEPVVEGSSPLLCGDQSMVSVGASLHWRVSDASAFVYGAADPAATLADLARSALVEEVAHRSADNVLTTGRASLEDKVTAATQRAADRQRLGVKIEGLHVAGVAVPSPVTDAFLDVISAEEEKRSLINEAEAYAADVMPRARGTALALLEQAEGSSQQLAARSEADLARFLALSDGGAASPGLTRFRVAHESAERALTPVDLVLVSPSVQLWLGDRSIDPVTLATGESSSRKER